MKLLLTTALALTASVVNAATRVAVIELGASGTVRQTSTASDLETSVDGVASFWSALHGYGRKLQHAGMPVVPDLFSRPDSGVVIGLTGVDLDNNMPTLSKLMNHEEEAQGVVGHMTVPGKQCKNMMKNVKETEMLESTSAISSSFKAQAAQSGISGLQIEVTSSNAADVDAQIASLLNDLSLEDGKTVVVHLIVEEEDGAERRRNLARRLEEAQGEGQQQGGEQNGENNNAEGQENNGQNNNGGFYGYGYYNAYGEWVTPTKPCSKSNTST